MAYPLENLEMIYLDGRNPSIQKGAQKYPNDYYKLRDDYHALKNRNGVRYSYEQHYDDETIVYNTVGRKNIGYVIRNNFDKKRFVIFFNTFYPNSEEIRINNNLAMKGIRPFIYEHGMVMDPEFYKLPFKDRKYDSNKQQYQQRNDDNYKIFYWITDYFTPNEYLNTFVQNDASNLVYVYKMFAKMLPELHDSNYVVTKFEMKQMFLGHCDNYRINDLSTLMCVSHISKWFDYPNEKYNRQTRRLEIPPPSRDNVYDFMMNNIVKIDFSRYNSVRTDESNLVEPIDNWMSVMFIMLDIMGMFIPDCIIYDNDYTKSRFKIDLDKTISYDEAKSMFDKNYKGTPELYKYYLNKYLSRFEVPVTNVDRGINFRQNEYMFKSKIENTIKLMKLWKKNFMTYVNWMIINYNPSSNSKYIKDNIVELMEYLSTNNVFKVDGVDWKYYNLFVVSLAYLSSINQFKRNYIDYEFMSAKMMDILYKITAIYTLTIGYNQPEYVDAVIKLNSDKRIDIRNVNNFVKFFLDSNAEFYPLPFTISNEQKQTYTRLEQYTCMHNYSYPIVRESPELQRIMNNVTGVSIPSYAFENENSNNYLKRMNALSAYTVGEQNLDADPRYYNARNINKDQINLRNF